MTCSKAIGTCSIPVTEPASPTYFAKVAQQPMRVYEHSIFANEMSRAAYCALVFQELSISPHLATGFEWVEAMGSGREAASPIVVPHGSGSIARPEP